MSSPKRSGNPAKQAQIDLTVKQQRDAKRQEKLAEYQRQLKKRQRGKLVWWVVGGVAVVAIAAVIIASYVFAPKSASYTAGSEGVEIEGVETFEFASDHVEGTVDYEQTPPAGGPHNSAWLSCGIYTEPQPNENAVHSLEHGAVWITYDPELITGEDLDALRALAPRTYAIVSPYEGLDTPIAVSAWEHQLKVDTVDDPRIAQFFEEYWQGGTAPELGASCTGIEGPGKI
ncbi:DUF3105 domain-containing protein [Microbacterium marinilacus]|uniref:DUF3105 domain-containing protein n=1 Tax=Microbacterium marinilacus TaxID=415209 RepID=A0ABP7BBH0_9MICO|nr:DUF3105 domain-containing protein [Microbacterium marinilacus]MBY0687063.1 DUF3105 domain-containing protein [Microbacterium marinilacus]